MCSRRCSRCCTQSADWPIPDTILDEGVAGRGKAYRQRASIYGVSPEVSPSGYFRFGYRLLGEGKVESAREALEVAAKRDPEYGYAAVALAMAYEHLGRLDDAVRSMRRPVEITKSHDRELGPLARRELRRLEGLQAKNQSLSLRWRIRWRLRRCLRPFLQAAEHDPHWWFLDVRSARSYARAEEKLSGSFPAPWLFSHWWSSLILRMLSIRV
jgi:tetratricopeptide (TPR) repeat protein